MNITPSHSRPRVSNDNAYAESLFRTLKYVTQWSSSGFKTREEAQVWVNRFTGWYNQEHRHSGIRYVTPAELHGGKDTALLKPRDALYRRAPESPPGILVRKDKKLATGRSGNAES